MPFSRSRLPSPTYLYSYLAAALWPYAWQFYVPSLVATWLCLLTGQSVVAMVLNGVICVLCGLDAVVPSALRIRLHHILVVACVWHGMLALLIGLLALLAIIPMQ